MKRIKKIIGALSLLSLFLVGQISSFPSAQKTYEKLNQDQNRPFAMSIGIAMSQTRKTQNTNNPEFIKKILDLESKKQKKPELWLKEREGYLQSNKLSDFSNNAQNAFIEQIKHLGIFDQIGCRSGLPNYRLSLEAADFLADHSDKIDPIKLNNQLTFIKNLKNPILFFHHYSNPQVKPHLFEKQEDITWFANYCKTIIEHCPQITHACPISQPIAFGYRLAKQNNLPPFSCSLSVNDFLENIARAQIAAGKAMKEANPHIKIMLSHQWKPFYPKHNALYPGYALEKLCCTIANRMYNGTLISLFKKDEKSFDAIALSVYPRTEFDLWKPIGHNCSGKIDKTASLEAIEQIHAAFPTKDIFIVETGCNTTNAQTKKDFIDMTLHICKIARDKGIPVKGVYFWGQSNDPEFYNEWNMAPGSTNFGPFNGLNLDSINEGGKYIREILQNK